MHSEILQGFNLACQKCHCMSKWLIDYEKANTKENNDKNNQCISWKLGKACKWQKLERAIAECKKYMVLCWADLCFNTTLLCYVGKSNSLYLNFSNYNMGPWQPTWKHFWSHWNNCLSYFFLHSDLTLWQLYFRWVDMV